MADLHMFTPDVTIVDGPHVRDFGVLFTTRMVVVKLASGAVWMESPMAVPDETLSRLTKLGPVRYLVAATPRHVWRLAQWHARFPAAQLWVPRTTRLTLQQGHVPVTGTLTDTPPPDWAEDFDQVAFKGNPLIEEVLFLHMASRTVILDDLIQNHPRVTGKPPRNALSTLAGVAYPPVGVPIDIRLSFTHRTLARRSLEQLLAWDFDKLIIGHGVCLEHEAKAFVEQAFHWLRRWAGAGGTVNQANQGDQE
jgi:hypothetical protein